MTSSSQTDQASALVENMDVVREVFQARSWEIMSTEPTSVFTAVETTCARYMFGIILMEDGTMWCCCTLEEQVPPRNHRSIAQMFELMNLDAEARGRPSCMIFDESDGHMTVCSIFQTDDGELTSEGVHVAMDAALAYADHLHDAFVAAALEEAEFRDISDELATMRLLLDRLSIEARGGARVTKVTAKGGTGG